MICSFLRILFFITLIKPIELFSQSFKTHIEENAIEIENIQKLDFTIYDSISNFELIMVGEMHGTLEPAQFVQSLSKLIIEKEERVSIGLEIPKNELEKFINNPSEEILESSYFFSKKNIDGRNGKAWFDLILFCSQNPKISLFYFDNYDYNKNEKRDSIMYSGIVLQKKLYPKNKIITLSGNIHNWKIPFNKMKTMGMYCRSDTMNFSPEKICSVNHVYSEGTMLNNQGNGLELSRIDYQENVYSTSAEFENYLLFYNVDDSKYDAVLYTKTVNQSEELNSVLNH